MTDLVEVLRGRNEHTSQRAADEIESSWAAIAELVAALTAIVKSLADQDDEGMIEHAEQMVSARAALAKHTKVKA